MTRACFEEHQRPIRPGRFVPIVLLCLIVVSGLLLAINRIRSIERRQELLTLHQQITAADQALQKEAGRISELKQEDLRNMLHTLERREGLAEQYNKKMYYSNYREVKPPDLPNQVEYVIKKNTIEELLRQTNISQ